MDRRTMLRAALAAAAVLAAGGRRAAARTRRPRASGSGGRAGAAEHGRGQPRSAPARAQLNIIAWAGYAEDGTNDKTVDWVTPFEKQTGCQVNVKIGNTSDEMVTLMKTGQYDGVSASGDATLRLIYSGDVAPVNTDLVPNYATVSPFLKDRPWNSVNGQMYGIPHGWGANVLSWRTDKVEPGARLLGRRLRPEQPVQGQDHRVRLADLHRRRGALPQGDQARPEDHQPVRAGRRRSSRRRSTCSSSSATTIGEYWSDYAKEVQALESGDTVLGTTVAGQRQPRQRRHEGEGRVDRAEGGRRPAGRTPG